MNPHPIRKVIFAFLHTLVLGIFALLIYVSADEISETRGNGLSASLLETTLGMGSFFALMYFAFWVFLPRYLVTQQYRRFFFLLLLLMAGYPACYFTLGNMLSWMLGTEDHMIANLPIDGLLILTFFSLLIGSLFRIFIQWFRDAYDKGELEKQSLQGELAMLKNQLNPHFLFNSLNNIDALIHANSPNASLALNKLSEMMRYMVYDSEKEWVTLGEELNYIDNYIELQRLRLVNQDLIQYTVRGEAGGQAMAPMIFISFVENAFKHASLKADAPPIEISFDLREDHLVFECRNAIALINKDESHGVGLENVMKRLNLIYRRAHQLVIDQVDGFFYVHLKINY